ncbi:hypothetical protein ID875_32785 [Streptomyces globisporus]|uniref:Ketosynthase family 3 (KS3) domain-containing protein n=1 Tax=Streptomyces globisporus TaxID=1908 RepID=A0A927BPH1_STRGL|nr:hypothetical protein [Streptomyces globisporus]
MGPGAGPARRVDRGARAVRKPRGHVAQGDGGAGGAGGRVRCDAAAGGHPGPRHGVRARRPPAADRARQRRRSPAVRPGSRGRHRVAGRGRRPRGSRGGCRLRPRGCPPHRRHRCRVPVPRRRHPEAFWDLLVEGRDAVYPVPSGRWDEDPRERRSGRTRWAALLEDPAAFDAECFGIGAEEARALDPQARIFLELAHEALERAGYAGPRRLDRRIGVFAAVGDSGYREVLDRAAADGTPLPGTLTGNLPSLIAARVSQHLDLDGPALGVDTACSSDWWRCIWPGAACWTGMRHRRRRRGQPASDLVPAPAARRGPGAVPDRPQPRLQRRRRRVRPRGGRGGDRPDQLGRRGARGRSGARGGPGHGRQQRRPVDEPDGPPSVAPARGHHPGLRGGGRRSRRGDLRRGPRDRHGGGRPDRAALAGARVPRAAGRRSPAARSVKTNIGHLLNAAALPSLVKVVLALGYRRLPPSLHHATPSAGLASAGFRVVTEALEWRSDGPLVAGINAFGFGGTNAHAVLEQAPEGWSVAPAAPVPPASVEEASREGAGAPAGGPHLLTLSARSEPALRDAVDRLAEHLEHRPGLREGDVCRTASTARTTGPTGWRSSRTVICGSGSPRSPPPAPATCAAAWGASSGPGRAWRSCSRDRAPSSRGRTGRCTPRPRCSARRWTRRPRSWARCPAGPCWTGPWTRRRTRPRRRRRRWRSRSWSLPGWPWPASCVPGVWSRTRSSGTASGRSPPPVPAGC